MSLRRVGRADRERIDLALGRRQMAAQFAEWTELRICPT
jgi:hypothetical protein